jgi:uncharacterized protein|tara:strand:+ start:4017 stop:4427 length:411 start_codon:yes stop_codon:yes gene_type:complete
LKTNQAKEAVKFFFKEFSSGDISRIMAAMHDQGSWQVPGRLEGLSGIYKKSQLTYLLLGAFDLYEGGALKLTPVSIISEGNLVAVEAESFAKLKDGRTYNNFYHFLIAVEDGKVKHIKEYMDTYHAWETFLKPRES